MVTLSSAPKAFHVGTQNHEIIVLPEICSYTSITLYNLLNPLSLRLAQSVPNSISLDSKMLVRQSQLVIAW
jgi:hypothetical protein